MANLKMNITADEFKLLVDRVEELEKKKRHEAIFVLYLDVTNIPNMDMGMYIQDVAQKFRAELGGKVIIIPITNQNSSLEYINISDFGVADRYEVMEILNSINDKIEDHLNSLSKKEEIIVTDLANQLNLIRDFSNEHNKSMEDVFKNLKKNQ